MSKFSFGPYNWFAGIVEDIKDPKDANRVRVRIYGYHPNDTSTIPTSSLPWAIVGMPTTSAGVSGIHSSVHGLVQGSSVVGFFLDGDDKQSPFITHSYAGIPEASTSSDGNGFVDPDGVYPTYTGEPDVGKLARGTESPENNLINNNGISEPDSNRSPKYPNNKVYLGTSGNIVEYDDTPGAERILIRHKSGAFVEMHTSGDVVYKSPGNTYDLTASSKYVNVGGNITVNVGGDANINVSGNCTQKVGGNYSLNIGGSYTINVGAGYTLQSGGSGNFQHGGVSQHKAPMIRLN